MTTTIHLPGILRPHRHGDASAFTLVTACGRRGPIKVRESAAPPPDLLSKISTDTQWERGVCPDCLVRWDAAEEGGHLEIVWALNGKSAWHAGGAVVWTDPPPCPKCKAQHSAARPFSTVFAAVLR